MISDLLKEVLLKQKSDFQRWENMPLEKIAFDTIDGNNCIRVCLRAPSMMFYDLGYDYQRFGYESSEELREDIVRFLENDQKIKYLGHNKNLDKRRF